MTPTCATCAAECCAYFDFIEVYSSDAKRLARYLDLPLVKFLEHFVELHEDKEPKQRRTINGEKHYEIRRRPDKVCVFQGRDGLCTVYDHRPLVCRSFPEGGSRCKRIFKPKPGVIMTKTKAEVVAELATKGHFDLAKRITAARRSTPDQFFSDMEDLADTFKAHVEHDGDSAEFVGVPTSKSAAFDKVVRKLGYQGFYEDAGITVYNER
jgi:Fe-S-cluster containining protein